MNTVALKVIEPAKKQPSTKDYIVQLEVGEEINAPYDKRSTIAPLISNIKLQFKGRNFKTAKLTVEKGRRKIAYLNIKRTA